MSFFVIFEITVLGGKGEAEESVLVCAAPPDTQHTESIPGWERVRFKRVMEWNKWELWCFLLPSVSHTSSGKPSSLPRQPRRNTKSRTIPCVRGASYGARVRCECQGKHCPTLHSDPGKPRWSYRWCLWDYNDLHLEIVFCPGSYQSSGLALRAWALYSCSAALPKAGQAAPGGFLRLSCK